MPLGVQGWVATLTQSGALPSQVPMEVGRLLFHGHPGQATLRGGRLEHTLERDGVHRERPWGGRKGRSVKRVDVQEDNWEVTFGD